MDPQILELLMQLFGSGADDANGDSTKTMDTNYLQDLLQMLNIPAEAMAASRGAYDYAAFQPTEETEYVPMPMVPMAPQAPSSPLLDAYVSDDSDEGAIAQLIANGVAPATAVNQVAEAAGQTDEKAIERWRSLASDLFKEKSSFTSEMAAYQTSQQTYNQELARYNDELAQMPVGPDGMPTTTRVKTTPSDAAKPYIDAGLPTPDQQFTQDDFRRYDTTRLDGANANVDSLFGKERALRDVLQRLAQPQPVSSGWGSPTMPAPAPMPTPTALQPAPLDALLAGDRQGHVLPVPQPSPMVGDRQGHMFPTPQPTPQHGRQGYALGQVATPVEPTLLSLPANGAFAGGGGGGGGGGAFSPQTVGNVPPVGVPTLPNAWADFMATITDKRKNAEAEKKAVRAVQGAYSDTQKARAKRAGEKSDARYDEIYSRKKAEGYAAMGKTPLSETLLRRLMGG